MSTQPNLFTVREARPDDGETFLSLIDALADYEKLDRPAPDARARLLADAFTRTPPRFSAYLLWEETESDTEAPQAVGYAIIFETYSSFLAKPTLYIEDLFLLPTARGKGGGNALFRFLAAEALRRGCGRMEWVCLNWNALAIGFYEKRGAEHMNEWRAYRLTEEKLWDITSEP
jgi:GNAT superfamily N-acetyltransferase